MSQFESFISRHGEPAAQAIVENWERYMGIFHNMTSPLENRWLTMMLDSVVPQRFAA